MIFLFNILEWLSAEPKYELAYNFQLSNNDFTILIEPRSQNKLIFVLLSNNINPETETFFDFCFTSSFFAKKGDLTVTRFCIETIRDRIPGWSFTQQNGIFLDEVVTPPQRYTRTHILRTYEEDHPKYQIKIGALICKISIAINMQCNVNNIDRYFFRYQPTHTTINFNLSLL